VIEKDEVLTKQSNIISNFALYELIMTPTTPHYKLIASDCDFQEDNDMADISLFDAGIVFIQPPAEEKYDHDYDKVESGNIVPEEKTEAAPQKHKQIISTAFALFTIAVVGAFAMASLQVDNSSTTDYSISGRHLVQCPVDVKMACQGCELELPEVDYSCTQAPSLLEMLFRGGSCEENAFTQSIMPLSCIDYNGGPPKLASNQPAFIRSFDETNNEIVFQGTVREGDLYNIVSSNGGTLGNKLAIDIFADSTQQTLLQSVAFELSCTEPNSMPLMNVFGASQIVGFANSAQGVVSAFAEVQVPDIIISIELTSTGKFTLQELSVRTNLGPSSHHEFPAVVSSVISAADPLEVSFQLPFNAGATSVDNIVRGTGVTVDGESCMFATFESFPIIL
jgi:hypothetical protein